MRWLANVDWIKIKTEYETTNISQRKIADKYGVSYNTLKDKSKRESWVKSKKDIHLKIIAKTQQKTVEKISKKNSDRNAKILELSDLATNAIEEYLTNKHYKQHIVKYKYYDCEGKPDREELMAIELPVADTKALSNIVSSLDKLQKGQRLAEGSDKPTEQNNTNQLDDLIKIMAMGGVKRE